MKKIKILLVTQHLDAGGVESSLLNICNFIDKQRYELEIICCDSPYMAFEDMFKEFKIYKAAYINTMEGKRQFLARLSEILKKGSYDGVHSNMGVFDAFVLRIAKKRNVRIRISHGHFQDSQYATSFTKKAFVQCARILTKRMIHLYSTKCVACSNESNEYCFNGKGIVVFNGINLDKFQYHEGGFQAEKDRLNLLTVGRISYAKNPLFIVDIVSELKKLGEDVRLTWVGVGGMEREVKERIQKLGINRCFEFLGTRKDVDKIMQQNDYFVLPSLIEGLPVALIEAQASGLDCFASNNMSKDTNCGKTKFLSVDGDEACKIWALEIHKHHQEKTWSIDKEKLDNFNINNTVKKIEKIYAGQ